MPRFALLGQSNNLHKNISREQNKETTSAEGEIAYRTGKEGRQHRMLYRTGIEHNTAQQTVTTQMCQR